LRKAYYEAKKDGSLERPGTLPSTQKQTADSKAKEERKKDGNIRRTRMASTDEGHIPALLADICAVKVLADSEADDNVMSHLTARRLSVAGFFMPTKKLESPISLQLTAKEITATAVEKFTNQHYFAARSGPPPPTQCGVPDPRC
jgi:hypothetical protein